MPNRSNRRFSPESTSLERRDLMTVVVKVPFDGAFPPTLNNQGAIVGPGNGLADNQTFYLAAGRGAKLTPLPLPPGDTSAVSVIVNDAGQVLGQSQADGVATPHSFLFSPKTGTVVVPFLPGNNYSLATALSKRGLVAGGQTQIDPSSGIPSFDSRAFLFDSHHGRLVDLGTLPGLSHLLPSAINDQAGLVVGSSGLVAESPDGTTPPPHLFSYKFATKKLTDLGTLPGFDTINPTFVDSRGEIAGTATAYNSSTGTSVGHVFLDRGKAGPKDIGLMPGFDQINLVGQLDDGRLVVQVTNSQTGATQAATYRPGQGFREIVALPTVSPNGFPNPPVSTIGPINKQGKAIVTTPSATGASSYYELDIKTHKLTDISSFTSQIPSANEASAAPIALNDRNQFLVPVSDQGFGDGADAVYLVSLNAGGKPAHITTQPLGASNPVPPGGATAMPIGVTPPDTQVPIPTAPVTLIPPPGGVTPTPISATTVLQVPIPAAPVTLMPVGNP